MELNKAKQNNDSNMQQRINDLKEKERKFEQRLNKYREDKEKELKSKRDYEEVKRMELAVKQQKLMEEREEKKRQMLENFKLMDRKSI